ncbi:MAG: hypothetical protein QOJ34_2970, partial [Pseudonocardiales bacterium]|nr:hypothetical protein [Pseudonocardiales bacterium]
MNQPPHTVTHIAGGAMSRPSGGGDSLAD